MNNVKDINIYPTPEEINKVIDMTYVGGIDF